MASSIDKIIRQLWTIVEDLDRQEISKRDVRAETARQSVAEVFDIAIAEEQKASPGLSRDDAIRAVVKRFPKLYEIHAALTKAGVASAAKADVASDSPSPKRQTRHERASRVVLERANDLVSRGEHPDVLTALKDKRMAPLLRQWFETSGT